MCCCRVSQLCSLNFSDPISDAAVPGRLPQIQYSFIHSLKSPAPPLGYLGYSAHIPRFSSICFIHNMYRYRIQIQDGPEVNLIDWLRGRQRHHLWGASSEVGKQNRFGLQRRRCCLLWTPSFISSPLGYPIPAGDAGTICLAWRFPRCGRAKKLDFPGITAIQSIFCSNHFKSTGRIP